jgi:hypothetical protein
MNDNKNYGIIREQGEFMEPVQLSEQDNAIVNESSKEEDKK